MRDVYDLTFWQNSASIHQAPLMAALAADGLRVRVVVPSTDNPARRAMGWQRPDYGGATVLTAADRRAVQSLAESSAGDRAHVFTGLGSNPAVSAAFRTIAGRPHGHLAVMTEAWDPRGAKGALRRVRYTARALRWRRHVDSVLAMGELAATQFSSAGIPSARVAQFIYSVAQTAPLPEPTATAAPEAVFVGRLEERKNPLLLVEAVASLGDVRLTMVGSGPLLREVRGAVARHGVEDRVRLVERLDNAAVRTLIAGADLLVLPSRYDGWGAVTNEALMAGTPAVVSDGAGSSLLVADSDRGRVFRSQDADSLTVAMRAELACRPACSGRRERIAGWARECISPRAVARYLRRVLLDEAPTAPPWLAKDVAR